MSNPPSDIPIPPPLPPGHASVAPRSPLPPGSDTRAPSVVPGSRKLPGFLSQVFDRIPLQEKINFARHLSLVIQAGLPVYEGLKIIKTQSTSKLLGRVIDDLMIDVNSGRFLADGLARYQYLFGDFFVNIVRVGESSGTLAKNLMYLAEELRRSKSLQNKVRSAMVYPIVILCATIAMSCFLTFFVFPKLIPVFAGLNEKLPFTTELLVNILAFSKAYGLYVVLGAVVLVVALRVIVVKINAARYLVAELSLVVPVLSPVLIAVNMVNFTRVLSLLLKSGVKIVEALEITAATFSNLVYQHALREAETDIRQGGQLADYITKHPRFFPPLATGMIAVGERTGNLDDNLEYLATYYEDEVDNRLRTLTSLIEPIMLLLMGVMVGFIALSIITPIYSITQGIQ